LTGKIKTSILIDENLWKKFKIKANVEDVSVQPKVKTSSGKVVWELRDSAA
jgi:hypothetical protein